MSLTFSNFHTMGINQILKLESMEISNFDETYQKFQLK
jgi:hypothetical protein